MARAVSKECPRCGAPLPSAAPGLAVRTCSYCQTTVELRDAEVTLPRPALRTPANQALLRWPLFAIGAAVLAGGAMVAQSRKVNPPEAPKALSPAAIAASAQPSARAAAAGGAACDGLRALPGLLLLDGGEHDALLLLAEPLAGTPRQRQLTARDASSGSEWWSRPVESEGPAEQLRTLEVGETLVVMLPHQLWGLDPQSGRMLWQGALDAVPAGSCATGRDFGLIDEKGRFAAYSSATGSPSTLARAACAPRYDSHSDAPNFAFVDAVPATRWLPRDDEFAVERGLLPSHGSAQVVLGTPRSGPSRDIANVGVLSGRRWLWQANVANEAPERARFTTPPLAAVRGERVVVPYVSTGKVVLTALELASGERRWTTALPGSTSVTSSAPSGSENQAGELAISRRGHAAYRQASGKLWVLSLDTGAIEWSLECKQ